MLVAGVLEAIVLKVAAVGELSWSSRVLRGAEAGENSWLRGEEQRPVVRSAALLSSIPQAIPLPQAFPHAR